MSKNVCGERLINGIVKENPTFVMMLGMCPTLAVTSSAMNGLGMGLSTTVVLILSIYRNCSIVCNDCSAAFAGVHSIFVLGTWCLHSVDCSKLYYLRTCRSLCFQKSGYCISI